MREITRDRCCVLTYGDDQADDEMSMLIAPCVVVFLRALGGRDRR